MKTIKDAYEDLKGDIENSHSYKGEDELYWNIEKERYICFRGEYSGLNAHQHICKVEEFNNYKPAYTFASGQDVFIAQINTLAGVESQRYYIKECWCACVHQVEYADLGLLFHTKEEAESKCRELIGLPPLEPPVKLVHGNIYLIDVHGGKALNAVYRKPCRDGFATFAYKDGIVNKELVTNIQPLTVEK